jgi:hypothetical protein
MVKISFALAALVLASVAALPDMLNKSFVQNMISIKATQDNLKNFVTGFVMGIEKSEKNPSECAVDFNNADAAFMNVIDDIVALDAGDLSRAERLFDDATELYNSLKDSKDVCNYSGLAEIIKSLSTDAGRKAIEANYLKNQFVINVDLISLLGCSLDYKKCGHSLGEVVRLVLGWGL